MKYKVGDKARVKSKADLHNTEWYIGDGMEELSGQIVTINEALGGRDRQPYRILEDGGHYWWSDDLFEPLTLKEQYFQTGYVVEMRDSSKWIVLRDGDKVALAAHRGSSSWDDWLCFEQFDDDLLSVEFREADIVAVYPRACRWSGMLGDPIWQREEPKEMTIEEIEKLVGSKVKIVGSQEGRE